MAYAAAISLTQTIDRSLYSPHIPVLPSVLDIIEFEHSELEPLLEVLQSLDSSSMRSERLNTLDGEIREAAYKLEDAIETLISNQLLSHQPQDGHPVSNPIDLKELKQDLDSFKQTVKKMKEDYTEELSVPRKVNDGAAVPSTPQPGGKKSNMVGFSLHFSAIKYVLIDDDPLTETTISLYGMAGIGKTTLARKIFEDPEIVDYFECRAWVRVGPEYQLKEVLHSILSQVLTPADQADKMVTEKGDDELSAYLWESLQGRGCLIVLDDIWESHVCTDLKQLLPDDGIRILVTTTIQEVADRSANFVDSNKLPFLDKEESWCLLREEVFGEEESLCPHELEKPGKKIAEKCDGLPLLIVTVAAILSKADKTVEYWNEVAETKQHSVFTDAYEHVCKFLLPSYNYLPQYLKPCFLYMGILPQDYEISRSKLVNLWEAEGFIAPHDSKTFEQITKECLQQLVSRSVVIVRQKVTDLPFKFNYYTEKYHLHSAFLYLCVKEAGKSKFYHVLNRYAEDAVQSTKGQRRLCIQNNVLFAIKDLYNSMSSVSAARSLLCTGPSHPYPVPICFGLSLLRVLDSLTIRFYEFPIEVLELIQLRYFAMTYDGELPCSISKLRNLECLIVNPHTILKSYGVPSYLPMEIWDMQELKHLQVTGSDLPDPCETSFLPNLLTVLDVSAYSCTKRVLERIPNLQRLGIRTGLRTGSPEPMSCFDHIPHLNRVETLTLIMDPIFTSDVPLH